MIAELRGLDATSPLLRGSRLGLEALVASDTTFAAMVDGLAARSPIEWGSIFRRLRGYRPDRALRFARRTRERESPGFKFNFAATSEATLLAALGRWSELDSLSANGVYAAVAGLDQGLDGKRMVGAVAGVVDTTGAHRAVAALTLIYPIDSAVRWVNSPSPVWKFGWLLGAYHATRGDTSEAIRWRATILAMPRGDLFDWPGAEAADIGSRLYERRGLPDSAASLAELAFRAWVIKVETEQDDEPELAIRFRRAQGLQAAGRIDSAAAVFRSMVPPTTGWGSTPRARSSSSARSRLGAASRNPPPDPSIGPFSTSSSAVRRWRPG